MQRTPEGASCQAPNVEWVLAKLQGVKPAGRGKWVARCPAHDDATASLSICQTEDGKVLLHCHAGCEVEGVVRAAGLTMADLFPENGGKRATKPRGKGKPAVIRYEVRNPAGELVAIHERRDTQKGKTFAWYRPDGSPGLDGQATRDLPLFGMHLLKDAPNGKAVVVCEGEKAADTLWSRSIPALGTVTGAAGTPGDEALRPLLEFPVVLWPDNDEPGREHMGRVGNSLLRLGHRDVRVVTWPDAPPKGDAADFQGNVEVLLAQADRFVAPQVATTAELLAAVEAFIRRFVVVGAAEYRVLSLWVLHTYTIEACECTPYLHVHSPEKGCGKSRLLEVLELVVANPWVSANTSAAALMRVVESKRPTVLLDEVDGTFGADPDTTHRIRSLLNSGFRQGGKATVTEEGPTGFEVREFGTFCCKALAGIGHLPDTILSRSLPIGMRRRAAEPIERLRLRTVRPEAKALADRLAAWAPTAIDQLKEAYPEFPDSLTDRQVDAVEPLLALADLAGGGWPERARAAVTKLCGHQNADDESWGVRLLRDIRTVFAGRKKLPTAELLAELVALEEAPWADVRRGRPLDARWLAARLKPFGIFSRTLRLKDEQRAKGYELADFDDAWSRYLPVQEGAASVTACQANNDGLLADSASVPEQPVSRIENTRRNNAEGLCHAGTDQSAEDRAAPERCPRCRGETFWRVRGNGNSWLCMTCHPPAPGRDVETVAVGMENRQDSGGGDHGGEGRAAR